MKKGRLPHQIYLYYEGASPALNLDEIAVYLREKLGKVEVNQQPSLISDYLSRFSKEEKEIKIDNLAGKLSGIKVRAPGSPNPFSQPLKGEIEYEKKYLRNPLSKPLGILYDGFRLQNIFYRLIPGGHLDYKHLHIIFTNQLFGTWDENDMRYHARTGIYGVPTIISTTGIVEAPAKPREFYLLRQQYSLPGKTDTAFLELKEKFKGKFIDYDDERLTEVVKGYCLQAVFFYLTGTPFCNDKNCRLYNAHWQEELITAQLEGDYELCPFHQEILSRYKEE